VDIVAPLHALTRKNARFSWCADQDEVFNRLKECLTTAPILGMPRDDGTFYIDTDASDKGVGAVLSQEQDGRKVVLAYASRTLSKPERNYDVTRREVLAVVFGLKTYRQYLLGRQFVIRTDYSALHSLRRTPEPIGQQARWQAFIEQFSFVIVHRPGTRHQNADALSRRRSWMIVSRVMIRLKTKFVELLLWVPDQLTQWSRGSISFGRGIDGRVAATQISVRFCDGDSSKLKNPDQSKW